MPGGTFSIHVDATPEQVYDLVSDITRMGEWSPETYKTAWRGGATGPVPGARFRGWNKHGPVRWFTDPVIDRAERGEELSFTTTMFGRGRFTHWAYRMHAAPGGGTELEESWEQQGAVPIFTRFFVSEKRTADMHAGMEATLQRIKAAAERS